MIIEKIYEHTPPRLKITRKALGLTQADMAQIVGATQPAYGNWERGLRKIDVCLLINLCDQYGLTLDWFYRGHLRAVEYGIANRIQTLMEEAA